MGKKRRTHNAKSRWWMNGSEVVEKKVKELVKSLNIQTGNLCQFLPQDKVHDFSKMNSKELLADHEKLKEIQNRKVNNESDRSKKADLLTSLKATLAELELDMAELRRRKELEKKIRLLTKKQNWCQVREFEIAANEERQLRDDIVLERRDLETKMAPKVKKVNEIAKKRNKFDSQAYDLKGQKKLLISAAGKITKRKEQIPDAIEGLNGEYFELVQI